MPVRAASFSEHKEIVSIAKTSKYTSGFTNMMFSSEDNYAKGWIGVVVEKKSIKGFICLRHAVRKKITVVYDLGVHPKYHKQGVGRKLIEWAMKESPYGAIQLNVDDTNQGAMKFYRKLGFRKSGTGSWGKTKVVPYTTFKLIKKES